MIFTGKGMLFNHNSWVGCYNDNSVAQECSSPQCRNLSSPALTGMGQGVIKAAQCQLELRGTVHRLSHWVQQLGHSEAQWWFNWVLLLLPSLKGVPGPGNWPMLNHKLTEGSALHRVTEGATCSQEAVHCQRIGPSNRSSANQYDGVH